MSPNLERVENRLASIVGRLWVLGTLVVFSASCVTNSDKCGNDMKRVPEALAGGFLSGDYCTPIDTGAPTTPDKKVEPPDEVEDGGDDGGDVAGECVEPCNKGEICDTSADPPECVKYVPSGMGEPCEGPEDCADYEADYCEMFVSFTCLIEACTVEPDSCPDGYICCDYSYIPVWNLTTLCVDEVLSGGSCTEEK